MATGPQSPVGINGSSTQGTATGGMGVAVPLLAPSQTTVAQQTTTTLSPIEECLKERYWSYFLASRYSLFLPIKRQ